MIEEIREDAQRRGISRLCHFTPSRNLVHIAAGKEGILATSKLKEDERRAYTPSDLQRLDGHTEYVPCSIEYPNVWYFREARRGSHELFKEWVVLLIDPQYLWQEGTRFCPRNAAAAGGRLVREGVDAFQSLYAARVRGAGGRTWERSEEFLEPCPTDNQAEVLVPDRIDLTHVRGIGVGSVEQAGREYARLDVLSVLADEFDFIIAPALYTTTRLSGMIRAGDRPEEEIWRPSEAG